MKDRSSLNNSRMKYDHVQICILVIALVSGQCSITGNTFGQEPQPQATLEDYIRTINQVRTTLGVKRPAEAAPILASTNESLRSLEFDYLEAQVRDAAQHQGMAGDLIKRIAAPQVEARYGVINNTSRQMVFICRDGGIRIHDLSTPEKEPRVEKHPQGSTIWSGVFSRNGKRFFSGHQNSEVLVWDTEDWKILHTVSLGQDWPVRELVAAPDGNTFVGESKTELELWSIAEEKPKKIAGVGERYNFGEGLAFSPKGDMLATGGMFAIILHDSKTGNKVRSIQHASYTMGLEFSPDGKRIASAPRGNVNKFLAVFEVNRDQPLFNAGPFGNYVAGMAFTPDGQRILATGCEKEVRLFDATTGQVIISWKRTQCSSKPGITDDGRVFGWNEPNGYVYIDLGKTPIVQARAK